MKRKNCAPITAGGARVCLVVARRVVLGQLRGEVGEQRVGVPRLVGLEQNRLAHVHTN